MEHHSASGSPKSEAVIIQDPSTVITHASSRIIIRNESLGKFLLHFHDNCGEAEFKVAVVDRVKALLEYEEEHSGAAAGDADPAGTSFHELEYPQPDDQDYLPIHRVLYKTFSHVYWEDVLVRLRNRNKDALSDDVDIFLLVFRLTRRSPARFDLIEVYDEGSVARMPDCGGSGADIGMTELNFDHAKKILSELGCSSSTLWQVVAEEDTKSLGILDTMTQRVSQDGEDAPAYFPYWPGDASLVYTAPDGADYTEGDLEYRTGWYIHESKEHLRLQSDGSTAEEPRPLVRLLSLQSYLAKQHIPGALLSVNAFGLFRQIINWFLLSEEQRQEMVDLYGDQNAGLYHVPAVLHRAPNWYPWDSLPRVIRCLFLERLPGVPTDDDERLARFEGSNLTSCSMSIANREKGESFLHMYSAAGVSWQSQKISAISDDELLYERRNTDSFYDDGYGDKTAVFDGYPEELHQVLAELYVNFRNAIGNDFKSYAQLLAFAGEDADGPCSLKNSVYISGRFGNYDISEMERDGGLSLWNQVKDEVTARVRQDVEGSTFDPDRENRLLDSELLNIIQRTLPTYQSGPAENTNEQAGHDQASLGEDAEGLDTTSPCSVALSNPELRWKLLHLQTEGWPSYALLTEGPSSGKNSQVRIIPNSVQHRAPFRTFRFFTEDDKREHNSFVDMNLDKLDSLRKMTSYQ
eukprot:TRINITY_DN91393_c0_g1_i1.p1 TRINITY_DN91393_c0_g1~~TRINITY_DN91393_c0_g1_i1.p1  ORF type:complete len:712 (+),score=105.35 TRINITY_DN91393_c0_g1_i1:62-2137(+)